MPRHAKKKSKKRGSSKGRTRKVKVVAPKPRSILVRSATPRPSRLRRGGGASRISRSGKAPVALGGAYRSGGARIKSSGRAMVVEHMEYVADVFGSTGFGITTFSVNPCNYTLFAWLSQIASRYCQYNLQGGYLQFLFETTSPTSATGDVIMVMDYDYKDQAFTTKQQMYAYQGAVSKSTWKDFVYSARPRGSNFFNKFFTLSNGTVPSGTDPRTYFLGNFSIATTGQASNSMIGQLFVRYKFVFHIPNVQSSLSGTLFGASFSHSGSSLNTSLFTNNTYNNGITLTGVSTTAFTINLTTFSGFLLLVQWLIDYTGSATGVVDLSSATVTGGSLQPFTFAGQNHVNIVAGSADTIVSSQCIINPSATTVALTSISNSLSATVTGSCIYVTIIPTGVNMSKELGYHLEVDTDGKIISYQPVQMTKKPPIELKGFVAPPKKRVPYGQQVMMVDNYGPPAVVTLQPMDNYSGNYSSEIPEHLKLEADLERLARKFETLDVKEDNIGDDYVDLRDHKVLDAHESESGELKIARSEAGPDSESEIRALLSAAGFERLSDVSPSHGPYYVCRRDKHDKLEMLEVRPSLGELRQKDFPLGSLYYRSGKRKRTEHKLVPTPTRIRVPEARSAIRGSGGSRSSSLDPPGSSRNRDILDSGGNDRDLDPDPPRSRDPQNRVD